MSSSESTMGAPGAAPTVKMPIMPLLLSVLAAVLLAVGGCGGVMYLLAKSGKLGSLHVGSGAGPAENTADVVAGKPPTKPPTKALAMEPLLANLSDADGHAYLRLGVTLEMEEPAKKAKPDEKETKGPPPEEAGLRDSVLEVLGREQSAVLLAADGKEKLKSALMAKFAERNADAKVREIFFTDFLVQR